MEEKEVVIEKILNLLIDSYDLQMMSEHRSLNSEKEIKDYVSTLAKLRNINVFDWNNLFKYLIYLDKLEQPRYAIFDMSKNLLLLDDNSFDLDYADIDSNDDLYLWFETGGDTFYLSEYGSKWTIVRVFE